MIPYNLRCSKGHRYYAPAQDVSRTIAVGDRQLATDIERSPDCWVGKTCQVKTCNAELKLVKP